MCGLVHLAWLAICAQPVLLRRATQLPSNDQNQAGEAEQKGTNPSWHAACGDARGLDGTNFTDPHVIVLGRLFERSVVLLLPLSSFVRLHVVIMPHVLCDGRREERVSRVTT